MRGHRGAIDSCGRGPSGCDSTPVADEFINRLLRFSRFGDPRVPPLSTHWTTLRSKDQPLFEAFLALLVKEDLALFFQHAMRAKDREDFWLHYVSQIRRTIPFLSKSTRAKLGRVLGGTEAGRGALARTRIARRGDVGAFCLFFDRVVVVEFSDTGNAAYVYPRKVFERDVLEERSDLTDARELKRTDVEHERLLHGSNWQLTAVQLLRKYGVDYPMGR